MKSSIILPKAYLILNEIQAMSAKWEKSYLKNSEYEIISINEAELLPVKFEEGEKINQVYIQHPFIDDIYVLPNHNQDDFELKKLNNLSQLSAILGAKRFKTTLINKEKLIDQTDWGIGGSLPAGSGHIKSSNNNNVLMFSMYELENEYTGNIPQYEKACDFALKSGLSKDKIIWSLIEKRNPIHNNLLISEKMKVNVSKEINKSLEVGASLSLFAKKIGVNASFNSRNEKSVSKELEVEIYF
ncbi:hypothetical protein SAMN04488519_11250 [Algoriphagus ornithinivorans]|uniref:Uncharacterized protein n=1 Tax=Algoriphagus ornithinivorans TaxID=226506 RepID=A0A1I5JDV2_9BACT|nr:hypothetical protein [Algoriphagus ornithinivorans]SFO71018.1 hypothetical protein SAMN04488519_11250 [Algoriphagus ornithinivorans]